MINECLAPDYVIDLQPDYDFEHLSINCVPLAGLTYKTDYRKLHQLIHGFVQGETAEKWINTKERKQDGRLKYLALMSHYGEEDNKVVRVKETEALQTPLIYNNERAMSFEKFLVNMQKLFIGFYDNVGILNDLHNIRLIFQKVQNPILTQIKESLQVSSDMDQANTVIYDLISNSLAAEAASI